VFESLTANGNKDASVKGAVETSGEMQEQEARICPPLKGSCSCKKPVQAPELLGAAGESNGTYEDSLSLEQKLERRRQLQQCPGTSHMPP